MNILIVDDEISSIEAVKKNIDWSRLDIVQIHSATSMNEAIALLSQHEINIMLCDIEMPMGTGLQLLRWVKDKHIDAECIFMTCHADFSYAKEALHLGSLDYLLKPLQYNEMEAVLSKAILKIKNEKATIRNSGAWLENKEVVLKQFWRDLFVGEISLEPKSLLSYIQNKAIDIDLEKDYIPVMVSIKKIEGDNSKTDKKQVEASIRQRIDDQLDLEGAQKEVIGFHENIYLVMYQIDLVFTNNIDYYQEIQTCCEWLVEEANKCCQAMVCCYVGTKGKIYKVPKQIETLEFIDFNNVAYNKMVLQLQTYKHYKLEYKNSNFNDWNELMQDNKFEKLLDSARSMLTSEENLNKIDRKFIEDFYQDFGHLLIAFALKHKVFLNQLYNDEKSREIFENAVNSLEDLLKWVEHTISSMKSYIVNNENMLTPVDKVKRYIDDRLSEEISMEEISQIIHLNADYLTRIFKKEFGVSVNRYIINQRIEKAKELLRNTDKSIGEIAMSVGYVNYSSFNKIFSKMVGMSPQEYKRSL